jgi:hypothetical protein
MEGRLGSSEKEKDKERGAHVTLPWGAAPSPTQLGQLLTWDGMDVWGDEGKLPAPDRVTAPAPAPAAPPTPQPPTPIQQTPRTRSLEKVLGVHPYGLKRRAVGRRGAPRQPPPAPAVAATTGQAATSTEQAVEAKDTHGSPALDQLPLLREQVQAACAGALTVWLQAWLQQQFLLTPGLELTRLLIEGDEGGKVCRRVVYKPLLGSGLSL